MSYFKEPHFKCYHWPKLFENSNDPKNRKILAMLIKKIPTFDFAIIVSDSTDIVEQKIDVDEEIETQKILEEKLEYTDGKIVKRVIRKYVMRDNVLFECGLCIMALGTDRVILLREKNTYIPPDLFSGLGTMGIETFEYKSDLTNFNEKLEDINKHIKKKAADISPIVIGAAISTADGYLTNFILRFWENIEQGFYDLEALKKLNLDNSQKMNPDTFYKMKPKVSDICMLIIIPDKINPELNKNIQDYYVKNNYKQGIIISPGTFRGVDFRYKKIGNKYYICDYPSTLTASLTTVNDILQLNADESSLDEDAENRFLMKERDSFVFTLNKFMKKEYLALKLKTFNKSETKIEELVKLMKQVKIIEMKSREKP